MEADRELVDDLADVVVSMQQWVDDLQSGMYVNCVYCGHRYGPREQVPETMADVLKAHVATCPQHPMSKLVKSCRASYHAISSLLADRTGITDELLLDVRSHIGRSLADAGVTL